MEVVNKELVEREIMLEHNVINGDIKQEIVERLEIDLRKDNLSHKCPDTLKEVTNSSSNIVYCVNKHRLQLKSEVDAETVHMECNLKQETGTVKFHFEPTKKVLDDLKDGEDGICCVTFKQQLEDKGHYLSESCLNTQEAVGSSSISVDFASEYNHQIKNEVGIDDGPREHNLKQETINSDIKQLKKEDACVNMHVDVINDPEDGIHCAPMKQEPEDLKFQVDIENHSHESCPNVQQDIIHSSLIKLDFAGEHNCQVKNEAGCEVGPRVCNLRQNGVNCDTERTKNETESYNSMQVCDGQCQVVNKREETHDKNHFQDQYTKVDSDTKKEWFQCRSCEYKSKRKFDLKRHIEYRHNKRQKESSKIFQCQFCEYKNEDKRNLKRHIKYNHNENPEWYHCRFCIYKTKYKNALIDHFRIKHDENPEMHQCQFCEYKSKGKSSLAKHINCKHNENAKWYQCNSCDYKTKHKSTFVTHVSYQHNENANAEWFKCSYCDYKAKYKSSLAKHFKIQHDENSAVHHCQFCEYKSKYKSHLERHVNYNHNKNAKWFQCSSCIYKTKYKSNLERHVEHRHNIRLKKKVKKL